MEQIGGNLGLGKVGFGWIANPPGVWLMMDVSVMNDSPTSPVNPRTGAHPM